MEPAGSRKNTSDEHGADDRRRPTQPLPADSLQRRFGRGRTRGCGHGCANCHHRDHGLQPPERTCGHRAATGRASVVVRRRQAGGDEGDARRGSRSRDRARARARRGRAASRAGRSPCALAVAGDGRPEADRAEPPPWRASRARRRRGRATSRTASARGPVDRDGPRLCGRLQGRDDRLGGGPKRPAGARAPRSAERLDARPGLRREADLHPDPAAARRRATRRRGAGSATPRARTRPVAARRGCSRIRSSSRAAGRSARRARRSSRRGGRRRSSSQAASSRSTAARAAWVAASGRMRRAGAASRARSESSMLAREGVAGRVAMVGEDDHAEPGRGEPAHVRPEARIAAAVPDDPAPLGVVDDVQPEAVAPAVDDRQSTSGELASTGQARRMGLLHLAAATPGTAAGRPPGRRAAAKASVKNADPAGQVRDRREDPAHRGEGPVAVDRLLEVGAVAPDVAERLAAPSGTSSSR